MVKYDHQDGGGGLSVYRVFNYHGGFNYEYLSRWCTSVYQDGGLTTSVYQDGGLTTSVYQDGGLTTSVYQDGGLTTV